MLIDILNNSMIRLKTMKKEYISKDIIYIINSLRRLLEGIDLEHKLVLLNVDDNFIQYIMSVLLWDSESVIMYSNPRNGKEYIEKIVENYSPRYVFVEKAFYYNNFFNAMIIEEFTVEGKIIVLLELSSVNDYMKGYRGCVFFTSGTTDVPKAVFRSERNMKNDAISNIKTFNITGDDKLLVTVPFGHVYGLGSGILPFSLQGATIYFVSSFVSGKTLKRIIEHEKITALIASPIIYDEILRGNIDISSCRLMLSAGSKLSGKLSRDFFDKYGKVINNMYGSSETGAISTLYGNDIKETDIANCGRPMYSVTLSCLGTEEKVATIKVKSESIAEGIIIDEKITKLLDEDGWYEMNDMGYLDDRGCIHLVCRKDDMINIGGEKISPKTIENVVEQYCGEALVLIEDNEDTEGTPVLYIENLDVDISVLLQALVDRLSYKFIPHKICVCNEFPRNSNGKIDRKKLKESEEGRMVYEC